jgi:hypothetical protein
MPACPICKTVAGAMRAGTPYWECPGCGLLFQDPLPPKLYQHPDEYDLQEMPEGDKNANRILADWLFANPLRKRLGKTLDIGSKHPVLAHYLSTHGCEAWAMDAEVPQDWLGVRGFSGDFEADFILGEYDLVTFIHVWEHAYHPAATMTKMRGLMRDEHSRLFLRIPDSNVEGIERDYIPERYSIHPYIHSLSSIAQLCAQTDAFVIEHTYALLPGQRDMVLRPI